MNWMRCILAIFIFSWLGHSLHGQNLVYNHSFEQQSALFNQSIPDNWFNPPGWNRQDWGMIGFDPFSVSIVYRPNRIDSLTFGFRGCFIGLAQTPSAYKGRSYIGLQLYDTLAYKRTFYAGPCCTTVYDSLKTVDTLNFFRRSFASTKLKSALQKDSIYVIEYGVHMDTYDRFGKYTKDFGIRLSNDTLRYNDYLIQSLSNTFSPPKIIREKDGWVNVKHKMIGNGDEQFLTIGNFLPDHKTSWQMAPTDTICVGYGETPFQYYFDAIYLYKATDTVFHVRLPADTAICPGSSFNLYAQHDDGFKLEDTVKTFEWSTGSKDSSITVSRPGTYWVKVTYNQRWWDSDTIVVTEVPPYQTGLFKDSTICDDQTIRLQVPELPGYTYRWSDGSKRSYTEMNDSGQVSVTVTTPCETVMDTVQISLKDCTPDEPEIFVPTAFTPNGDGLNDFWLIYGMPIENEVQVFDRWGQKIFSSSPYQPWDGMAKDGKALPLGIYIYKITFTYYPGITVHKSGWVSILR